MSFDPFEIRLQFLSLLRKLNASQQSIQTVTSYAAKYARRCGEDLWDCVMEECGKGNLNIRINILYFLDTLCDPLTSLSYLPTSTPTGSLNASQTAPGTLPQSQTVQILPYTAYLNKDLEKLIGLVVPESREGILNLLSAKQILDSWKVRRFVNPETCEKLIHSLEERRKISATAPHPSSSSAVVTPSAPLTSLGSSSRPAKRGHHSLQSFSRTDKLRRMEEDRERHKRLRERMWVLPMKMPPGMGMSTIIGGTGPAGGTGGGTVTVAGVKRDAQGQPLTMASPATTASPGNFQSPSPFTPASPSRMPITPSESNSGVPGTSTSTSAILPPRKARVSTAASRSDGLGSNGSISQLDPIDVEFDLLWDDGSDLEDEDLETMRSEQRKKLGIGRKGKDVWDDPIRGRKDKDWRIPGLGVKQRGGTAPAGVSIEAIPPREDDVVMA